MKHRKHNEKLMKHRNRNKEQKTQSKLDRNIVKIRREVLLCLGEADRCKPREEDDIFLEKDLE